MQDIKLFSDDYIVKYRSEEIQLLRKEFQLFECLFRNPSRVFTRAELLELVWAQEDPTDRTIDDHIYRVRKKLTPISPLISIETLRGIGYRLKIRKQEDVSPLNQDDEVSSSMNMLFHKYQLYGQGDALKLLVENQSVFGFELNLQSRLYINFMNGNFRWIAEATEISFWDRCFYLLHIYSYIAQDKNKCLDYFKRALLSDKVPEEHQFEMEWLNQVTLLAFTGKWEEAKDHLKQSVRVIHEKKVEGFIPNLYFIELYLIFLQKDSEWAKKRLKEIERELESYPFSREQASFMVIKGIESLYNGDEAQAKHFFDTSLDQFIDARYIPGLFISLNIIIFFISDYGEYYELHQIYKKRLKRYELDYKLTGLQYIISRQLDTLL
ncbi:winged helix-turn-helix domain-containing protein [Bacillus seohaeanensis]|uniref:Winged helix-turn-helix domain-containing protein n=1 Tax=Bacillus seohaeanensis TaxID=284580 RepID=A0ABW5RQJ7_9BACI